MLDLKEFSHARRSAFGCSSSTKGNLRYHTWRSRARQARIAVNRGRYIHVRYESAASTPLMYLRDLIHLVRASVCVSGLDRNNYPMLNTYIHGSGNMVKRAYCPATGIWQPASRLQKNQVVEMRASTGWCCSNYTA
jgi:hypothetical protein